MTDIRQELARGRATADSPSLLRELPSWLTSAVVHLAVMLALGLIYLPISPQVFVQDLMAVLDDGPPAVADATQDSSSQPRQNSPSPTDEPGSAITRSKEDAPESIAIEVRDPVSSPQPATETTSDPPAIQPSRLRSQPPGPVSLPLPSEAAARLARLGRPDAYDAVVERFIQYDIGKLTGRPGQQAKETFDRLGDAAIPALVRGLNRSAGISDSCPVLVISKKLDELLKYTDDAAVLLYVLENVGHGIHPRAHHWQQIINRRNDWVKKYGLGVASLREQLANEGRPKRTLESGGPFRDADADELAAAVTHHNEKIREQALAAIAKRGMTFGDAERYEMAQPLIRQLEAKDAGVRHSARKTLIALAGGAEVGPSNQAVDRDPEAAAAWWRDRWTQFRVQASLARGMVAKAVESLRSTDRDTQLKALATFSKRLPTLSPRQQVKAARALIGMLSDRESAVRDQARAALEQLAGIKMDVAGSTSDETRRWTEHWDQVERHRLLEPRAKSLLSMAQALEDRGAREQALPYYRKIIKDFPRTAAAEVARSRTQGQGAIDGTGEGP